MESATPPVFTSSNQEGVDRVVKGKGNYAFLMESTSIEYVIERNCELTQIGGMLDSKGYGIAMPPSKLFRVKKNSLSKYSFRFPFSYRNKSSHPETSRRGKAAHFENKMVEGKERWWRMQGNFIPKPSITKIITYFCFFRTK